MVVTHTKHKYIWPRQQRAIFHMEDIFPHWKYVLQYCSNCTSLVIPVKYQNISDMNTCTTMCLRYIY